jgi:hypothetical protein
MREWRWVQPGEILWAETMGKRLDQEMGLTKAILLDQQKATSMDCWMDWKKALRWVQPGKMLLAETMGKRLDQEMGSTKAILLDLQTENLRGWLMC